MPDEYENKKINHFTVSAFAVRKDLSSSHTEHDIHMMVRIGDSSPPNTDNNLWTLYKTETGVIFSIFRDHPFF